MASINFYNNTLSWFVLFTLTHVILHVLFLSSLYKMYLKMIFLYLIIIFLFAAENLHKFCLSLPYGKWISLFWIHTFWTAEDSLTKIKKLKVLFRSNFMAKLQSTTYLISVFFGEPLHPNVLLCFIPLI